MGQRPATPPSDGPANEEGPPLAEAYKQAPATADQPAAIIDATGTLKILRPLVIMDDAEFDG